MVALVENGIEIVYRRTFMSLTGAVNETAFIFFFKTVAYVPKNAHVWLRDFT